MAQEKDISEKTLEDCDDVFADFFLPVYYLNNPDSSPPADRVIRHVDETMKLMTAITGNPDYIAAGQELLAQEEEGGTVRMRDFLEQAMDRGREAAEKAFHAERSAFQAERNAFQAEINAFQAERNAFQAERNAYKAEISEQNRVIEDLRRQLELYRSGD